MAGGGVAGLMLVICHCCWHGVVGMAGNAEQPENGETERLIELRRVSRQFGAQQVLRDVSVAAHAGETLVLIGESGCGKSVTLKLMMGLLEPSAGGVFWDERPVAGRTEMELNRDRLRIGYLFQGAALFDSLNVYENVAFGLRQNTDKLENEIGDIVCARLTGRGIGGIGALENALRVVWWNEKASGTRAGVGAGTGNHSLRRADNRARPDYERRD